MAYLVEFFLQHDREIPGDEEGQGKMAATAASAAKEARAMFRRKAPARGLSGPRGLGGVLLSAVLFAASALLFMDASSANPGEIAKSVGSAASSVMQVIGSALAEAVPLLVAVGVMAAMSYALFRIIKP